MKRIEFLATLGALGAAVVSRGVFARERAERQILLWLPGGLPHTETFDPKKYAPFEHGMDPRRCLTTSPSIPTSVDCVRFTRGLEKLAGVMDRGTLIRSFQPENLGAAAHGVYQARMLERLDVSRSATWLSSRNAHEFSASCLRARQLAENGTRSIVVEYRHVPFGGWDAHEFGHERVAQMKAAIDAPAARLVLELEERGMLDSTRVILASEFSRLPDVASGKIESERQYGCHAHYAGVASVLVFGGGAERGRVIGQTDDKYPADVV